MTTSHQTPYQRYRQEIYRIGWRVQYRAKKIKNNELPIFEIDSNKDDFTCQTEDRVIVMQLINDLPTNGQYIIEKIYLQGFSEAEVAQQLNISQQAVNKWKKKMLRHISQKVSSWN
ncbi:MULTISPECIES: sigma factor-like helix-turn-helix DNA-binding protein [unclassified Paenibacillus]|uniref:Sigma factor-like helix-turn-helix DNA-binding protein n=1 Tax=Paenibacillus provencensis TaxID=441151 RepID=A0ABW3QIB1_9BACL|nr:MULTISPECIES: sigma factor-like helix-turn-helix DNA-binding protein [unclassified Paenibacillus]MCM3131013.1 ECF-type sigma factor [Paenibacillus sp. MER 78]SDX87537.1 RNA polymerase sigma factor, sigma-70 family [Paenibacillus sp. PDC88]